MLNSQTWPALTSFGVSLQGLKTFSQKQNKFFIRIKEMCQNNLKQLKYNMFIIPGPQKQSW